MQDNIPKSRRTKILKYPRIVSCGQTTGVDVSVLDAAISAGVECGWCPPLVKSGNGPLPAHYPLVEIEKWTSPITVDTQELPHRSSSN